MIGSDEWYPIKGVIDERVVEGMLQLLVVWDGLNLNGRLYRNSWVRLPGVILQHDYMLGCENARG